MDFKSEKEYEDAKMEVSKIRKERDARFAKKQRVRNVLFAVLLLPMTIAFIANVFVPSVGYKLLTAINSVHVICCVLVLLIDPVLDIIFK